MRSFRPSVPKPVGPVKAGVGRRVSEGAGIWWHNSRVPISRALREIRLELRHSDFQRRWWGLLGPQGMRREDGAHDCSSCPEQGWRDAVFSPTCFAYSRYPGCARGGHAGPWWVGRSLRHSRDPGHAPWLPGHAPARRLAWFWLQICPYLENFFAGGSDGKESACSAGDLSSIPELGTSPGGGHGNRFRYSCLENPHGQRSLGGLQSMGSQRTGHGWSD